MFRTVPCQFNSCPINSGYAGFNASRKDLYWVNSYPASAIGYGLVEFGPRMWSGRKADLAVSGPNAGANIHGDVSVSGTVGAAAFAARKFKVPAIAVSYADEDHKAWNAASTFRGKLHAALAAELVNHVAAGAKP